MLSGASDEVQSTEKGELTEFIARVTECVAMARIINTHPSACSHSSESMESGSLCYLRSVQLLEISENCFQGVHLNKKDDSRCITMSH